MLVPLTYFVLRDLAFRNSLKQLKENAKKAERLQKQELEKAEQSITELSDTVAEAESLIQKKV